MNRIINEYIRRTADMCRKDSAKESKLRWYHNVLKKDENDASRRATEEKVKTTQETVRG